MKYNDFYDALNKAVDWRLYSYVDDKGLKQYHDVILNKEFNIYMKKRLLSSKPHLLLNETVLILNIDVDKYLGNEPLKDVMMREAIITVKAIQSYDCKVPVDIYNVGEKDIADKNKVFLKYELFLKEHIEEISKHVNLVKELYMGMLIKDIQPIKYIQALYRLGFKDAESICGNVIYKQPDNYKED